MALYPRLPLQTPILDDRGNLTRPWILYLQALEQAAPGAGAGVYLAIANNLSDLANAATARTNLGLGDSATRNVGTAAGTVAAGDHTHAGAYLAVANNLSDVPSPVLARFYLGLGDSATRNVGTTAGTVAAGDHTHSGLASIITQREGVLAVASDACPPVYNGPVPLKAVQIYGSVRVAPAGSALGFLIKVNGVDWYGIWINDGATIGFGDPGLIPGLPEIPAYARITINLFQVGASTPGTDLTVQIWK